VNTSPHPLPKTLPGAVCVQWRRCGKRNCRCADGRPHGPYHYRFWREQGRLRKQYVPRVHVLETAAACEERRRQHQARQLGMAQLRELRQAMRHLERLWKPQ